MYEYIYTHTYTYIYLITDTVEQGRQSVMPSTGAAKGRPATAPLRASKEVYLLPTPLSLSLPLYPYLSLSRFRA